MTQESKADLLSRIADFERTKAYFMPNAPDLEAARLAHARLRYALARLPAPESGGTPLVVVDGIVYGAAWDGGVIRGRVVELNQ